MHLFAKMNLSAVLGLVLAAAPLSADTVFSTTLSGANETPPVASSGTGSMLVTLLGDMLNVSVNFSGSFDVRFWKCSVQLPSSNNARSRSAALIRKWWPHFGQTCWFLSRSLL